MKRNGFALASALIASVYFLFVMIYFSVNTFFLDSFWGRSSTIHILFVAVALAANLAGYVSNAKDGMLVAGIAYCISAATFILYAIFLVLPIVFSFIAFSRMKKGSNGADANKAGNSSTFHSTVSVRPEPSAQYDFLSFRVAGVSFKNEDGKSRQSYLRKMRFRDPPFDGDSWDITLNQYEYEDEDAIGVYVNGYMIGNVPREKISYITLNWDRFDAVTAFDIIGGGETESGETLKYGAEVRIRFRK